MLALMEVEMLRTEQTAIENAILKLSVLIKQGKLRISHQTVGAALRNRIKPQGPREPWVPDEQD